MAVQQDMQGFPLSGTPVTKSVNGYLQIGNLYPVALASNAWTLDVLGNTRLGGTLITNGISGTTLDGTTTITSTTATTLYVPSDSFISTNIIASTAAAPIQRGRRMRFTSTAWDLGTVASVLQNWTFDVKNVVANPVGSRLQWGYMSGTTSAEGYAETMNLDNTGKFNVLGTTYGSESMTNGVLTSGTSWTQTGDMALAANAATYTHSTGAGSLSQASGTLAVAGVANRWYKFVYTASATTTGVTAYIDTTFAAQREYLNLVAGTYTVYFKSAAAPGNFTITATSTAGAVTLDTFSLKECQSGDITANGLITGGGATGIKVNGSGNVGVQNAAPAVALDVTGEIRASTAGSNAASVVTVGGTQTLTNKTLTSAVLTSAILKGSTVVPLTDGATIATDASLGNIFTVTLGGNRTLSNPTNPTDGQKILYRLKQDGAGTRTITWGAAFRFSVDIPSPTLTTTINKTDYVGFVYNGTDTVWDCLAVTRGY